MDFARGRPHLKMPRFGALKAMIADRSARLVLPLATSVAIALGGLTALIFLVMPTDVLEGMSVDSGIASLVTAAQPPLGLTARFAIAFLAALGVGGVAWFGLFLLVGTRTVVVKGKAGKAAPAVVADDDIVPILRRRDAHPDAPARRPVFAHRDLGTPFLDVKADPDVVAPTPESFDMPEERDLPVDLDTPMARYLTPFDPPLPDPDPLPIAADPVAEPVAPAPILAEPPVPAPEAVVEPEPVAVALEPEVVVEPQPEPRFAANERIETFDLTPVIPAPGEPAQPSASIHDLLDRLERGVAKRQPAPEPVAAPEPAPAPTLEDTLAALRQLAQRAS